MDSHLTKRLVIVKMLQLEAEKYANDDTEYSRTLSIIVTDASNESLLRTIYRHFGGIDKRQLFHEIWKQCNTKINETTPNYRLPFEQEIMKTHTIRNNSQHLGIIPDSTELKECLYFSNDFFKKILEELFNSKIEHLYLSSIIKDDAVRNYLNLAEKMLVEEKYVQSIQYSTLAFKAAIENEQSRIHGSGWGLLRYAGKIEYGGESLKDFVLEKRFQNIKNHFNILFESLDNELEVLKLNLDYKKYQHFKSICPNVSNKSIDSTSNTNDSSLSNVGTVASHIATKKNASFCYNFVLDTALKWERFRRPSISDEVVDYISREIIK